jgi:hypothetical protein
MKDVKVYSSAWASASRRESRRHESRLTPWVARVRLAMAVSSTASAIAVSGDSRGFPGRGWRAIPTSREAMDDRVR